MVKSRSVHFDGKEEQTTGADDNFIFLSLLLGNYEHMHERLPFFALLVLQILALGVASFDIRHVR